MDRDRFAEALMSFGDTVNQAYGGKQNIYGTYQEQKTKREQMEREAEQARLKQYQEAYTRSLTSMAGAKPTQKQVVGFDPTTGINVLQDNPNFDPISNQKDVLGAERKTYAGEGFLPISRTDIIGMNPMERMRFLRNRNEVRTSPDTGMKYSLGPEEKRRQSAREEQKIGQFGRIIDPNDQGQVQLASSALGMDPESALLTGRAEMVDVGGKKKVKVLSERDWVKKTKSFSEKENEGINSRYDVNKSFMNITNTLKSIGDLPKDIKFDVQMEQVDSGMPGVGKISIPARIKIVGQLAKDPKYTAVARELERAFGSYRKVITGAQAAASELVYLRDTFPQLTDQPAVFLSSIQNIMDQNKRELETRFNTWDDAGRDTKKFRERFDSELKNMSVSGVGSLTQEQEAKKARLMAKYGIKE